jgi:starch synthase
VAGALPKSLRANGVESLVISPLYQQTDRSLLSGEGEDVWVDWRGRSRPVRVFLSHAAGAPAYLIDAPEYFARSSIYGFRDDHERYAFFGRAALSLLRHLDWRPNIVHGNDWPWLCHGRLRARRRFDPFFQGTQLYSRCTISPTRTVRRMICGGWGSMTRDKNDFLFNGNASALKAGLMAADALSTVSRRYAWEIQTPEQGHGLDWLLRMRQGRLVGITNGVDFDVWNPQTDPHIASNFSANDLTGKRRCKIDLLRRFGLPEEPHRPLIAIISRLVAQKGYDLIKPLAGAILEAGCFFIALGAGASEYENFLQAWHDQAPHRVGIYKGYAGEALAHQIEAGADMFLMPSLYEPCGLNQMYSMRYGTVPIVRATGGLDDTVENFNEAGGKGNGFKFESYHTGALLDKIREALYFYGRPDNWVTIQRNGMSVDNSWDSAARRYIDLYERDRALNLVFRLASGFVHSSFV